MGIREHRRDIEATRDVNDYPTRPAGSVEIRPIEVVEDRPSRFSEPPTTGVSWRDRWATRRAMRTEERREQAARRAAAEEVRRAEVAAERERARAELEAERDARRAELAAAHQAQAEAVAEREARKAELDAQWQARHAQIVDEKRARNARRVEIADARRARRLDYGPLPLRLMLGAGLVFHGWPKLFTVSGHEGFTGTLDRLGVPYPDIAAWGLGGFEVIGGFLLIVGALVGLVSLIGIFEMLGAIFLVHLPHGFSAMNGGYEVPLLYLAGFLALLITGAGALSVSRAIGVDAWRRRRRRRYVTYHEHAPTPAY